MELNGTAAYVKYNRFHIEHRPQYVPDPFRSENFYYNKKEDYCVCPMGQHMTRTGTSHKTSASGYVSNRATYTAQNCEGCPLRCLCFDASGDRRVIDRNHKQEAYRQKASELLTSEEGLRHRGKRCIEPEAVFGQIKYNMAYRRFRHIGVDKVKMDFAFFAIAFNIKKMVAKMTKGGLFSYLRAYLTNITPYKLFIRIFFVEKQKLVVHPHKNVQRVFFIYIGSFDTPSSYALQNKDAVLAKHGSCRALFSLPSYREAASKKVLGMRYCHHLATAQRGGYVDDALVRAASEDQVWITLCKDEGSIDQHIDPFEEGTLAGMGEDLLKGETRIAPDGLAAALAQAIGQACEGFGLKHRITAREGDVGEWIGQELVKERGDRDGSAMLDVPRLGVVTTRTMVGAAGTIDRGAHARSIDHRVVDDLKDGDGVL